MADTPTGSVELRMTSYKDAYGKQYWDFDTQKNLDDGFSTIPLVAEDAKSKQDAIIACYLQVGTIPMYPEIGVDWAKFLTGQMAPAELNATLLKQINTYSDSTKYFPEYKPHPTNKDQLIIDIGEFQ